MIKPFFQESDCEYTRRIELSRDTYQLEKYISLDRANALLRERGKVVYGKLDGDPQQFNHRQWLTPVSENNIPIGSSHTALLVNIEPIEQDSTESLLREIIEAYNKKSPPSSLYTYQIISAACDGSIIERARKLLERKGER